MYFLSADHTWEKVMRLSLVTSVNVTKSNECVGTIEMSVPISADTHARGKLRDLTIDQMVTLAI
jgi:hypothetical protein